MLGPLGCSAKPTAPVDRDRMNRRVVIDHAGNDGLAVEHELGFNRRGQRSSRTLSPANITWLRIVWRTPPEPRLPPEHR